MSHEVLNLQQAAAHVFVDANDLRHVAQRGEIAAQKRGDDWFFEHRALDEWAQRNLLAAKPKTLSEVHRSMADGDRRARREVFSIVPLFRTDGISLDLLAKTKGGAIRDMTDLAIATGLVYDDEGLFKELVDREEAAPTAVGRNAAFLHPRYHDPYFFEDTFIAYGRARRPVFFGAPDGEGTRHFFMICSTDHERHLQILARLALLAHGTALMERLDLAESADDVIAAVRDCESEFVK
ncbi:MAG: PTS sugar transporter subunit IIA [Kiritimatiellae bacterium]|nr:PTS sugar transporter subunit IIA [Kiritimatiellia bacterium]